MTYVFVPWRSREEVWTAVFPKRTLCVLPVAGRFFIEHQLDWAASCGATRVIVLDYGYSDVLANMLTGGERHRWPFELIYDRFAPLADELVVRRWCEASYGGESPDRIIAGPMFPYKGELREIVTVSDYADINFKVLSEPGDRTLAGYSSEVGVQLGMNVVIKTGREIVRPISLGDNVLVDFGCRLLGRVIVDHNSILDRESVLEDSIVLSYTYVGRKMELRRKIVDGGRVVDIDTGEWVDIEESGLCGRILNTKRRGLFKRMLRWIVGGIADKEME